MHAKHDGMVACLAQFLICATGGFWVGNSADPEGLATAAGAFGLPFVLFMSYAALVGRHDPWSRTDRAALLQKGNGVGQRLAMEGLAQAPWLMKVASTDQRSPWRSRSCWRDVYLSR